MTTFAALTFVLFPLLLHFAWSKCGLDGKDGASKYTFKIWGRQLTRRCGAGKEFSKMACGCVKAVDSIKNPENLLNGKMSDIRERPWAAMLAYQCPFYLSPSFQCSASMIGAKWALTAEHCRGKENTCVIMVDIPVEERWYLYGGSNKRFDGMKWATVKAFYYDTKSYGDIMLVETKGWFYRKGIIEPISIMTDTSQVEGRTDCFRTGFGRQSSGVEADGYLYEAPVCIVSYTRDYNKHMIETRDISKRIRTCGGDSGGGLVCPTYESGSVTGYQLLGVTQSATHYGEGKKCEGELGITNQYITFGSAPKFVPFIERYTKAPTPYEKGHREREWERGRDSIRNAGRGKK